jgi:hypothetical protein
VNRRPAARRDVPVAVGADRDGSRRRLGDGGSASAFFIKDRSRSAQSQSQGQIAAVDVRVRDRTAVAERPSELDGSQVESFSGEFPLEAPGGALKEAQRPAARFGAQHRRLQPAPRVEETPFPCARFISEIVEFGEETPAQGSRNRDPARGDEKAAALELRLDSMGPQETLLT